MSVPSIRPIPVAPTKMQSASRLSASAQSRPLGSSSFTTEEVVSPIPRSFLTAASTASAVRVFSPAIHFSTSMAICSDTTGGGTHIPHTTQTSLPFGQ